MRNRYYDTSRVYTPFSLPMEQPEPVSRNAQHIHDKQTNAFVPGQSTKQTEKDENDNKVSSDAVMNETNHEKVHLIDDSSNNVNNDDDDSQIKYLYSLYKNRLSNNF